MTRVYFWWIVRLHFTFSLYSSFLPFHLYLMTSYILVYLIIHLFLIHLIITLFIHLIVNLVVILFIKLLITLLINLPTTLLINLPTTLLINLSTTLLINLFSTLLMTLIIYCCYSWLVGLECPVILIVQLKWVIYSDINWIAYLMQLLLPLLFLSQNHAT